MEQSSSGPLVYPAGFVYVYSWLKKVTGGSVAAAQPLFAVLYAVNLSMVRESFVRAGSRTPLLPRPTTGSC